MRPFAKRPRGFTLAELLLGLVVTSIVLTATAAIFIGVQRVYQAETEIKVVTENGRGTLMFLERVLPLAGYGLDPRLAFDVTAGVPGAVVRDNYFVPAAGATNWGTVVTDDLAFRYRDPAWLRAGRLNSASTTLTVDEPFGLQLPLGKLLMVACRGGADYAVMRTSAAVAATATTVPVVAAGAPFLANTSNCLTTAAGSGSPWVFLVHEHRLRVINLGGRPWLVSFRNLTLDVTNINNSYDPIAPDIETFQVAFGLNRARPALTCCQTAPDNSGNWIFGDVPSPIDTVFAQPANVMTTKPDYRTSYDDPSRFAAHPANIRTVHLALVIRSARLSPAGRATSQLEDVMNWDAAVTPPDGYYRSLFHTAINTPNLLSRSFFTPSLRSAADMRDLNSWGG